MVLHTLAAIVWVGGMFFAHFALRPVVAGLLEPPLRLQLWYQVFTRFFFWVWVAVLLLLATGLWMIIMVFGGMAQAKLHIHLMLLSGLVMMALFSYLYFAPYRKMRQAVSEQNWTAAAQQQGRIRLIVMINLSLGLLTSVIAVGGRYLV